MHWVGEIEHCMGIIVDSPVGWSEIILQPVAAIELLIIINMIIHDLNN